jgi:hypothetical protein
MDKVVERFYGISGSSANGCDLRLAIVNEIAAQIFLELICINSKEEGGSACCQSRFECRVLAVLGWDFMLLSSGGPLQRAGAWNIEPPVRKLGAGKSYIICLQQQELELWWW